MILVLSGNPALVSSSYAVGPAITTSVAKILSFALSNQWKPEDRLLCSSAASSRNHTLRIPLNAFAVSIDR